MATNDIILPSGICSITTKKAVSVTLIASAGTMETPKINSLIVLPLDIRAIKTPTNGAHAIHHAQ